MKHCKKCDTTKPLADFGKDRCRADGLNLYCKLCIRAQSKRQYYRNPAGEKARKAAAYVANRERFLARNRAWRAANRERERETNRAYYQSHKDLYLQIGKAYRARKESVPHVPFTSAQLAERWAVYGNKCWMCGAPATCTDHVKPIARGGANMLCNLRPACRVCNAGKRDRWPWPVAV